MNEKNDRKEEEVRAAFSYPYLVRINTRRSRVGGGEAVAGPEWERGRKREREREPKMSWQSYVDDHLMCDAGDGNTLTAAAILGHDGAVWAKSASFPEVLRFLRFPHLGC